MEALVTRREFNSHFTAGMIGLTALASRLLPGEKHINPVQVQVQAQEETSVVIPEVESKTPLAQLQERSDLELPLVIEKIRANKLLDEKTIGLFTTYYPIYRAVGEYYDIPWFVLMHFHRCETSFSQNKLTNTTQTVRGFSASGELMINSTFGAMQRDVNFYPERVAEAAFAPLSYLSGIKTTLPTDPREIAFAAWKLRRDLNRAGGNWLSAFSSYCNSAEAYDRWTYFNWYKRIFNS